MSDYQRWSVEPLVEPLVECRAIITAGSTMEKGAGEGVFCQIIKCSFKLNNNFSVFEAEIIVITKSVEIVRKLEYD